MVRVGRVAQVLPERAERALIVHEPGTSDVAHGIGETVAASGRTVRLLEVPAGEDAKTMRTVEWLCRQWSTWGLTRGDCVVAVGGGMVTDVVGFAAACYHRGVPVVHVSTTLLGMIEKEAEGKQAEEVKTKGTKGKVCILVN